nr:hypothetical protein [Tanacetum cinerariifolium]
MVQKSRIQCYNCKKFRQVTRECQKPKRTKDAAYHREKMLLCKQEEAGIQLNAEQADWKDDTDDESDDQELEAHYMYMAKIQEVSPDAVDSGPIFDTEPEQKVQNDDHYDVFSIECQHPEQYESVHETYPIEQDAHNVSPDAVDSGPILDTEPEQNIQNDDHYDVFTIECQHPEQSESVHETYLIEQDAHNVIIESVDMNYDSEQIDQNDDDDADLAKERDLELSNNQFKEANNKLSVKNDLMYADFKKSQAELKRRDSIEYASEMEL